MGSGALPLILFLMFFINPGLTQDLPTSTLTVSPDSPVFTEERVTLKCEIESYSDWTQRNGLTHDGRNYWTPEWKYEWYKDSVKLRSSGRFTVDRDTLTITGVITSDQGQYTCRGQRDEGPQSSRSSSVNLTVTKRPRPVLKVTPDQRVFREETVTLTCDIQTAENIQWTYSWFKDGHTYYPTTYTYYPYATTTSTAEISFRADYVSAGEYSCRAERDSQRSSHISAAVKLTVSDSTRSTLTVSPDSPVFTEERVTLKCVIETYSNWRRNDLTYDWTYEWYKDRVKLQSSGRFTVNRDTVTIRATESDQGWYRCRGQIRSVSSESNSVYLSVKGLPRSTLTVSPDSPVFTGERVTLKCVIETYSDWTQRNGLTYNWKYDWTPEWRYEWYKDSVKLQSSDGFTVNRHTLTIRATESDQGQYTCRGQRDERPQSSRSSSEVYLSVKDLPRSKVIVTPDSAVFTGDRVNLKCVIESDHRDWRYEWYKDSVKLQSSDGFTVNRDTLTIRKVNESDQGQYTCRGQRDERPQSSQKSNQMNLSVNVQAASSSLLVTGVVLGLLFLFFISLLLLWRYKKNKDQQRNIKQTSVPDQPENSALQSDPDHIYDDVTEVNKRHNDDPESFYVTYSEVTVQKNTSVDKDYSMEESNEVTYSEVRTKVKKCKSKGP